MSFEKSRNIASGEGVNSFAFHLTEDEETGGLILETGDTESGDRGDDRNIVKGLLLQDELTQKEISRIMEVSTQTVGNVKKELVKSNLIKMGSTNTKWTITNKGMKTLELIKEDYDLKEYSR